jgi:hypothetical protein
MENNDGTGRSWMGENLA